MQIAKETSKLIDYSMAVCGLIAARYLDSVNEMYPVIYLLILFLLHFLWVKLRVENNKDDINHVTINSWYYFLILAYFIFTFFVVYLFCFYKFKFGISFLGINI